MSEWFFAHAGERFGPMAMDELQRAAADGKLKATDRAWTDGWPDWRPATDVPGLTFADGGRDVGYFEHGTLPSRAHATLKPYAPPTGDTGAWPLGEAQIDELAETVRLRRRQQRAVRMLRALALLHVVMVVVVAVMIVQGQSPWGFGVAVAGGLFLALGLLHLLAARSIGRNRLAGSVIGAVAVGLDLLGSVSIVALEQSGRVAAEQSAVVIYSVAAVVLVVCLIVVIAAGRRMTRFRRMPAWCQEAVLAAEAPRRRA